MGFLGFFVFFLLSHNGQVPSYSRKTVCPLPVSFIHLVDFFEHPKNFGKMHSSLLKLVSQTTSSMLFKRLKIRRTGTSLVVQWLRICLPMQGTRVRALVREDPTCRRATTEPVL